MKTNTLKQVLAWHKCLGLVLGVFMLVWALTGVLHPIMSATQPQPAKRMPPSQQLNLQHALPLPTLLQQQGLRQVSQVQVIQLNPQHIAYRVVQPNQAMGQYFDAHTGQLILHGEQRDAEQLAVWYIGLKANQINGSQLITSFNDDYPSVNRLLPVWRVEFDNGLRAYIEPSQRRLATVSNDSKMWMARIFRLGHTWRIGQNDWWGQTVLMKAVLMGLLAMALLGLVLFVKIHNRQNHRLKTQPARWFHRYLGISLWCFMVAWLISGLYHQWHHAQKLKLPLAVFQVQNLTLAAWQRATTKPLQQLNLVAVDFQNVQQDQVLARAAWMLRYPSQRQGQQGSMTNSISAHAAHLQQHSMPKPPKIDLLDANTAQSISVQQQAFQLTAYALQLPVSHLTHTEWITQFAGEYGFLNKRLPVIKVQSQRADDLRVYIEPSSGLIASNVNNGDALEGFSFAYLHKWRFIDINKTVLDVLMATTALLIALMVGLGYRVYLLKRQQRK